jgi:pyruvate kinase
LVLVGVQAFQIATPATVDDLFDTGANLAKKLGIVKSGDSVVITEECHRGGPLNQFLRVHKID